ncbi:MAG TPA: trigger factor [Novimethylophilus sp.]|jgi:trigger factor|uniref:trigger factor n=1 Tax=Novimethylophilus sp. TaxID=2137426 RepID=UPI002F3F2CF0
MQATVETISNLERRLTVAMPMQPIEEEIGKRLGNIARTAKMAGFRPGKVPYKMVVQQYGPQVRQEVISGKVEETFSDAVHQHALKVAGYPSIEPKPLAENADNYEYVATFEIFPEVKIGDLSGVEIERPKLNVAEADVDKTVDVLRKQRAVFEPAGRGAEMGDSVTIEFSSEIDGQQVENTAGQTVPLVLGEQGRLPDFDTNLVGAKAGETRKFDLAFPADYHNANLAGKTASYEVKVVAVAAPKLPEVDAGFARELGVEDGDVAKMRAEIKESLEQEIAKRIKAAVKAQVMSGLVAAVDVELPRSLVTIETGRQMEAAQQGLQQRGVDLSRVNLEPSMFEEQAARNVKLRLILVELVRANELQAKPEQIRAAIDEHAKSFEQPDEVVNWYYADAQRLNEPAAMATEENVVNWVLERAKVTDKKTSFDELMSKEQA